MKVTSKDSRLLKLAQLRVSTAQREAQLVSWPDGAHSPAVERHSLPSKADESTNDAQG